MKRDLYWDSLKFILIFLVVYTHTIETYAPMNSINRAIYNLIYTFHMPLFIFISGRFSHISDKSKYWKGIFRLLETYIVFQVIWWLGPIIIKGKIDIKDFVSLFVIPRWTLWYLLNLVYWRLLIIITPSAILKDNAFRIMLACFVISIGGGFLPVDNHFSFQRTMAFLPFFFLGYYSAEIDIKKYLSKIPIIIPLITIISALLIICQFFNYPLNYVLACSKSYWFNSTISPLILCSGRIIVIIFATIISIMVIRIVKVNQSMSNWGTKTMIIYVYHSFVVSALRIIVARGIIPQNEYFLFLYAILITMGLLCMSRFKLFNIIMNPFSFYFGNVSQ